MSDWKGINERLAQEHGDGFRFGYVSTTLEARLANASGAEQRSFELREHLVWVVYGRRILR